MATPVVPSQFCDRQKQNHSQEDESDFLFRNSPYHLTSINWGGADEQLSLAWITMPATLPRADEVIE
jgi:hypothetical protein